MSIKGIEVVTFLLRNPGDGQQSAEAEWKLAKYLNQGFLIDCCTPVNGMIFYTLIKRPDEDDEGEEAPWMG